MGLFGKTALVGSLACALLLGSGNVYAGDSFPVRFAPKYEVRISKKTGRDVVDGKLEKDIAGYIEMNVEDNGNGYFVKLSARSEPTTFNFKHESKYKLSDTDGLYRSLENFLDSTVNLAFYPVKKILGYLFESTGSTSVVKINKDGVERKFDLEGNINGPFALLANFFSGDCYKVGRHSAGRMKGASDCDAEDVYIDVSRDGKGYVAEMVMPKGVLWEKSVPLQFSYIQNGDVAEVSEIKIFAVKTFGMFDKWLVATPAVDGPEFGGRDFGVDGDGER